jgi:DNA-binding CsgD family transcriptional regulator/tetratricopeptide (TPR) repeat protein
LLTVARPLYVGAGMSSTHGAPGLRGRRSERAALDRLLAGIRDGQSSVLVLRGEAGVGKTALLEYVIEGASGCRIARAAGVESEMELAFAGVHQLCAPMLDRLEHLPAPQRDALATAIGLKVGKAPDRFLVGLAVLGLLAEAAERQPLVCLVDDAQWLDRASAQTLAFVARRVLAESVALVFAVREPSEEQELAGLPELVVKGLSDGDARALLDSAFQGPLDEGVRDRIVAETRGNPLALLELPRGLTPAQLAGGLGLPDVMPVASRIEQSYLRRLHSLPVDARRFLLVAAAEPVGDVALLWRAVEGLGIGSEAAPPAEAAGLIELGARVRFHHPLVRSAVHRAATLADRQEAHRALAEATDPEVDPDRRAWHRANAAVGPDEDMAGELERSASRVQARGGFAAAAAFLERATELTPDPARRAARALAAAQAKLDAAAPDRAEELLAIAERAPLDELPRARADVLRGHIAFARSRAGDASRLMLAAARRLEPLDAELARETYLEAFGAAMFAGRLSGAVGVLEVADAARAAGRAGSSLQPPRALDLLLDGLVMRFTEGYPAGVAPLKQHVRAMQELLRAHGLVGREVRFAFGVSPELWDDEAWHESTSRGVRLARDAGALTALPVGLTYRASLDVLAGDFSAAAAGLEEADAISAATGIAHFNYASMLLAAVRGDETQALHLIKASVEAATARGEGRAIGHAEHAAAVLYNGLGRYPAALAAAERACEYEDLGVFGWALVELVEAGARSGTPEVAAAALKRLAERTSASATDWALGIEARSRALLSDGEAAERLYREAIERLGRTRIRVELARAHLLYGEWLRRERRRMDARDQLRTAYGMFVAMGAEGFAERARRELAATGETVRKRTVETRDELTAQEAQIARLASDGHTSPEIGAQLFLSPRTVDWHLRKVFAKLGINSRRQLPTALSET